MRILLTCSRQMYDRCMTPALWTALNALGEVRFEESSQPSSWSAEPPADAAAERKLIAWLRDVDALIIGPGAPRITETVLAAAPQLDFIGELEGDRLARRIDMAAADRHGIRVVDTSSGSSLPVAEWALALIMIGLRNAGAHFRRLIAGMPAFNNPQAKYEDPGFLNGELTGRRVGLVACGNIGRRLIELLAPFETEVWVYDPYLERTVADVYDLTVTSLDAVVSQCDVVVCTAPHTPQTDHLIERRHFQAMRPGTVFVNVSRGAVIDTDGLAERLRVGDMIACLDVYDPEPIPADAPVRSLPNAFLSPHIAGVTAACGPRFLSLMIDDLRRHLSGQATRHDLIPRL